MKALIEKWFKLWYEGNYENLPLAEDFSHTSPFGTIEGKETYLDLVRENEDKFLGYTFTIHDSLFGEDSACVRYTGSQGEEFSLDVSEWYYAEKGLIKSIVSYYHIGEIREERQLD